jgi:hypothetical protein
MVDPAPATVTSRAATWRSLLARAAAVYDEPGGELARTSARAARGGFATGAVWMHRALVRLRGRPVRPPSVSPLGFQALGGFKYGVATASAVGCAAATWLVGWPPLSVVGVPVFYAIEAQGVFLFPLALDGCPRPLRAARRWTVRAGGTVRVMAVVMPVAATMLLGGLAGRGFVRSWCLGCLAVCVWYEDLRATEARAA